MIDSQLRDELFDSLAQSLDIPEQLYEDAVLKYEDIGDWLAQEASPLHRYDPEVYPQGSFRLGTVVRPLAADGAYDIDLVCHLSIAKKSVTQEELKRLVGYRLRQREDLRRVLEERRRCWSLDYPGQFHMDVLPAIPNEERPPTGILLTDRDLRNWQLSNPKLYGEWFFDRMRSVFEERRLALAKALKAEVEEVPEWRVRTPLQRVVQLLKRHRDVYFAEDDDAKPVSIIITTLAAHAYQGERGIYDAVHRVLSDTHIFIENRNGRWWVENPAEPGENFADRWNEHPERRETFLNWLRRAKDDFDAIASSRTEMTAKEIMGRVFRQADASKPARIQNGVPALADVSHCRQPPWPERIVGKATLTAGVYGRQHGRKQLWNLTQRPVPKGVWLRFRTRTNIRPPYDVAWQVVNSGVEAAEAKELRGDFDGSEGDTVGVRWESTAYTGTHWVEAFVIKDDVCVARTGPRYVRVRG